MRRPDLRAELLGMEAGDDRARAALLAAGRLFGGYDPDLVDLHRRNGDRLSAILDEAGWPGEALVGRDGAEAAYRILVHAMACTALLRRAIPLLCTAARAGQADWRQYASLVDRVRVLSGRLQLYGTQHDWDDCGRLSPEPIEDEAGVDARRAALGLAPLAAETARLRREAEAEGEGEEPPADPGARRLAREEWARRAGWRPPVTGG